MAWKDTFKAKFGVKSSGIDENLKEKIIEEFINSDDFTQTVNEYLAGKKSEWLKEYQESQKDIINTKTELKEPTNSDKKAYQDFVESYQVEGFDKEPEIIKMKGIKN